MRLGTVKNVVGLALVGLHFLAMILCWYWLESRLSTQDFRITILILSPVTSVYALAYVREVIRTMYADTPDPADDRLVTQRFSYLSIFFSFIFSAGVIYTIYQYKQGTALAPDDLKDRLALIETALGVFLGLVVETLFGKLPPSERKPA